MRVTPSTLDYYRHTAGVFVVWLHERGITEPARITAAHVRAWLAEHADRLKDTSLHARARAVRTLVRFLHAEGYMPALITFAMPRLDDKRLPFLEPDALRRVLASCDTPRAKALVLLLVDSGIRREEASLVNWGDLNFENGALVVRRGKGGKARTVAVGAKTLRALLAYRRTLKQPPSDASPLLQNRSGNRLTQNAIGCLLERVSDWSGVAFSAHVLRRTFAVMSLRSGMDLVSLQRLMGHADIAMTSHYLQMVDTDLLEAHRKAGVDCWL
jgi:integrase/recombinase XerD